LVADKPNEHDREFHEICSERKVMKFVLREKYCWLVADKPNEHDREF
jgi:hypothetical protein